MRLTKPRIVILGGGYAGVRVARDVARRQSQTGADIVLINDGPLHIDVTSFYEVATAYLDHESDQSTETIQDSVSMSLSDVLANLPVRLIYQRVERLDAQHRLVVLANKNTLSFDYLIIALGSALATYGVAGVNQYSFNLKTLHDAVGLRHHIVRQFHSARHGANVRRSGKLTFVVVGAGAAGVETAGELMGCIAHECARHNIQPHLPRVVLVEAAARILNSLPERVSQAASVRLRQRGVEILTARTVKKIEADRVIFSDDTSLASETVIWAGGLAAQSLLAEAGLPIKRWGVACDETMRVLGHTNIYVVGDAAVLSQALPATVPVAYSQASLVARNIVHQLQGEPLENYHFKPTGMVITLGGRRALLYLPPRFVSVGWWPWLVKRLVTLRYWSWYVSWPHALIFWLQSHRVHSGND